MPETDVCERCVRCVMDTSDPDITFDSGGVCNHCRYFDRVVRPVWHPDEVGARLWAQEVDRLKQQGRRVGYDCVVGLSGGLDSASVVLMAQEAGLKPLVVHVDAGWNSELAVKNIESLLRATGFDLFTVVVDWDAMRRLQLAYLRAGVINQDVPQDQAFIAGLSQVARRFGVRDILSGHNYATESVLPTSWGWYPLDIRNLKSIYRRFGDPESLHGYPMVPSWYWLRAASRFREFHMVRPLNWAPYDREVARRALSEVGWRTYPRKHGESRFTVFYQEYFLPQRFGVDKRVAHYSSLILSGMMTRPGALAALGQPMFDPTQLQIEKDFVARKLRIALAELEALVAQPVRQHTDFANTFGFARKVRRAVGRRR